MLNHIQLNICKNCLEKLKQKVREDKVMINKMQRFNMKIKAEKKDEVESFYEAIAFGPLRAARIVRTAMGAAQYNFIMQKMFFGVKQDTNYR